MSKIKGKNKKENASLEENKKVAISISGGGAFDV